MEQRTGSKKRRRFKARGGVQKRKRHQQTEKAVIEEKANGGQNRNQLRYNRPRIGSKALALTGEEPTTLDRELYSYLVRVQNELESLSAHSAQASSEEIAGKDDDDDDDGLPPPVLLAQNAVCEIIPRLHEVAVDPSGSRVLQSLLRRIRDPEIVADMLRNVVSPGASRFASLAEHRCASHVLQDICTFLSSYSLSLVSVRESISNLVQTIMMWDLGQLLLVMESPGGSHVLRSVFGLLAGISPEEPRTAKLDDSSPVPIRPYFEISRVETPQEWHRAVIHFANLFISTPDRVKNLPWSTAPCSALQCLISASACIDRGLTKKLVKAVMVGQLSDLVFDSCGSRFVERAVTCLGAGIVWDEVKGHLGEMIAHPKANHVAQRVFLRLSGRSQVKAIWDEVEPKVMDCLRIGSGREGVALAMVRAAEAEGDDVQRRRASKCIAKSMETNGENSKYFVGAILRGSVQEWLKWSSEINSCGLPKLGINRNDGDALRVGSNLNSFNIINVLIARSLLRFRGAAGQAARDSMNSLSQFEILALIASSVSSRVIEQWVDLDTKNSEKVIQAVMSAEPWSVLATAKSAYGAMVISRCIPKAHQELQKQIMDVLGSKIQHLKQDRFGSVVVRKCRVESYVHDPDKWRNMSRGRATRARLFEDLFQSETRGN